MVDVNSRFCPVEGCSWYALEQHDWGRQYKEVNNHYLAHIAQSLAILASNSQPREVTITQIPPEAVATLKLGGKS